MGGARGNLLGLLEQELEDLLPCNAHELVNARQGLTGLAYKEIFPEVKNVLKTRFESREELMEDVVNSSTFPFFTSNWPFLVRSGSGSGNRAGAGVVKEKEGLDNRKEG
eukprot:398596_1